jgi:hypothetical protein
MSGGLWETGGPKDGEGKTTSVNGSRVQSYWLNLHVALVIPIDSDYAARLGGTVAEDGHRGTHEGVFTPGSEERPCVATRIPRVASAIGLLFGLGSA